jgi:hypothetical protein
MIILRNLSFDIIIGMEFLQKNKVIIDAADMSIHFSEPTLNGVNLINNITIPAFASVFAPVNCRLKQPRVHTEPSVLTNYQPFTNRFGVFVAQGPILCNENAFNIMISNLTNEPARLQANECVGKIEEIIDYHVHEDRQLNSFFNDIPSHKTKRLMPDPTNSSKFACLRKTDVIEKDYNSKLLNIHQIDEVKKLLCDFSDIFASINPEHEIKLTNP